MLLCTYAIHLCTFDTEGLATLYHYINILFIDILIILAVRVYEVASIRCFGFGVVTK